MADIEMSDEEARRLLRQRMEAAGRRVAMAAFVRGNPPTPAGVDDNGTVSFLSLPGGKFVVTNHHVWDALVLGRATDPSYRLLLMGEGLSEPVDITDAECKASNHELDLCVLSYPPERIEAVGKEFYVTDSWPPERAASGDTVVVAGYPGMRRHPDEVYHPGVGEVVPVLHHELVLLYPQVVADSSRQAWLQFSSPDPETIQLSQRPITEYRWGGMSGSLVYRFNTVKDRFLPCGILHSTTGQGRNAVFAVAHLDCIRADGSIPGG